MKKKDWFDEWFDTHYYHILYKNRDNTEAAHFLNNLVKEFDIDKASKILDLACGKGRHSIALHEKGLDVVGVDLSKNSIDHARQFEQERLKFYVHDMREVFKCESFDFIFNLFTSFGYFESKQENLDVIEATTASLKKGGKFIFDFLNPYVVINNLVAKEEKVIEGVKFEIERKYTDDEFIVKNIDVTDQGKTFHYFERVKAIRRVEFLEYFEKIGLKVLNVFGDYDLNAYDNSHSPRLIFILQKTT